MDEILELRDGVWTRVDVCEKRDRFTVIDRRRKITLTGDLPQTTRADTVETVWEPRIMGSLPAPKNSPNS